MTECPVCFMFSWRGGSLPALFGCTGLPKLKCWVGSWWCKASPTILCSDHALGSRTLGQFLQQREWRKNWTSTTLHGKNASPGQKVNVTGLEFTCYQPSSYQFCNILKIVVKDSTVRCLSYRWKKFYFDWNDASCVWDYGLCILFSNRVFLSHRFQIPLSPPWWNVCHPKPGFGESQFSRLPPLTSLMRRSATGMQSEKRSWQVFACCGPQQ